MRAAMSERVARLVGIATCVVLGGWVLAGYRPGAPEPPLLPVDQDRVVRLAVVAIVAVGLIVSIWRRRTGAGIAAVGGMLVGALWMFEASPGAAAVAGGVPLVCAIAVGRSGWRRRRSRAAVGVIVLAVGVVVGVVTARGHQFLYGSTHPSSAVAGPPGGKVDWVWSGGAGLNGAVVTAAISDGRAVGLRTNPPATVSVERQDADVVRFRVSGVPPGTRVTYAVTVDGVDDGSGRGGFRTLPRGPASFEVAFSSCARTGSNGAVFDTIRKRDPLMYLALGDMYYANIDRDDPGRFRRAFDRVLTRPAQANLYRATSISYVWDDHDFGPNDADATSRSAPAAHHAYRTLVPHGPLALSGERAPLAQAFTIGRVRFVITDTRSGRTPGRSVDDPAASILGGAQRTWFEGELIAARDRGEMIVWVSPVPWIGPPEAGGDGWEGYPTERREVAKFLERERITNLVMLSGDTHAVAIDDGSASGYATGRGFPVAHGGALDREPQDKGGPYSEGVSAGGGRFGTLTVTDVGGDDITLTLSGWDWSGRRLMTLTRRFALGAPPAPTLGG